MLLKDSHHLWKQKHSYHFKNKAKLQILWRKKKSLDLFTASPQLFVKQNEDQPWRVKKKKREKKKPAWQRTGTRAAAIVMATLTSGLNFIHKDNCEWMGIEKLKAIR